VTRIDDGGLLVIISAPSGAGKDTVIERLGTPSSRTPLYTEVS